jgi:hypothetical protein
MSGARRGPDACCCCFREPDPGVSVRVCASNIITMVYPSLSPDSLRLIHGGPTAMSDVEARCATNICTELKTASCGDEEFPAETTHSGGPLGNSDPHVARPNGLLQRDVLPTGTKDAITSDALSADSMPQAAATTAVAPQLTPSGGDADTMMDYVAACNTTPENTNGDQNQHGVNPPEEMRHPGVNPHGDTVENKHMDEASKDKLAKERLPSPVVLSALMVSCYDELKCTIFDEAYRTMFQKDVVNLVVGKEILGQVV